MSEIEHLLIFLLKTDSLYPCFFFSLLPSCLLICKNHFIRWNHIQLTFCKSECVDDLPFHVHLHRLSFKFSCVAGYKFSMKN